MLKHLTKSIKYYSASIAAIWAAKSAIQINVSVFVILLVFLALLPVVLLFVLLEERYKENPEDRPWRKHDVGVSFTLQLAEALEKTSYADLDDEGIASQANAIVRSDLDKSCISYGDYKIFRTRNPFLVLLSPTMS